MKEIIKNINWEEFHFLRPDFLWLLIPAILIFVIGMFLLQENIKWQKIISPHLRKYMITEGSGMKRFLMHLALFLTISLAIIGLSGPTWKKIELPGKVLETPLVILLDLSQSMMAVDIQPNRLERAKFKINDLITEKPGARIALVGFAGTAHTIIPLTSDYKIINTHVKSLSPKIMPFAGSDLEAALILADTITAVTTAPGTVLVFSDDFDNNSFELLQKYVSNSKNKLIIVPMNTANGSKIPIPNTKSSYFKNTKGEYVISQLKPVIINKLKSIEGITVSHLTLDNSDMELLAKNISKNLEFKEKDKEKEDDWEDYGLWFILPFIALVLFWFRKGWVLFSVLFVFSFSSCQNNEKEAKSKFIDLWLTKDYQAQQLYNSEQYQQAGKTYNSNIRSGIAWYKSGDYEKAIEEFEKDTSAMATYNLGLAYYQNGDYAASAMAFGIAAELDNSLKEKASNNQLVVQRILDGQSQANIDEATEAAPEQIAKNKENKDSEDLGGGGQEAKKEDLKKERKEETVSTDIRKGKEMEFVPDDFKSEKQDNPQKIVMQRLDDDPALFLKRKFIYQVKKTGLKPKKGLTKW
ncbi:MAG: VWA domain-containing protein [Bacteroidales bacterium]|nr:VWA domain-containing protein [Bacteroidales bacterium]